MDALGSDGLVLPPTDDVPPEAPADDARDAEDDDAGAASLLAGFEGLKTAASPLASAIKSAGATALDLIDRGCEALVEPDAGDAEPGALGAVLKRLSGDEAADEAELRRRDAEDERLARRHAADAAELDRRAAETAALRARVAERRRNPPAAPDDLDESGFVVVRDVANPTGADPPVPPPDYCVVSIAAD
mmetsp:Transcript_3980/g.12407  ORF Transcript_3980/g.12407 Transcript_3980/m.12407 type:complete len:190 (+) Transcript_3980:150-719(+)